MGSAMRSTVSSLLAIAACVLAVVAIAATWMDREVMQTDHWTQTSVEVLRDPEVQELTAGFLADQLIGQQDAIKGALPAQLKPFAGTATQALRDTGERVALDALRARALEDLWRTASRNTHRQFVRWLDGGDTAVTLDLQPALDRLAERVGIPASLVQFAAESGDGVQVALIQRGQFRQTRDDARRLEQAASLTLPLAIVVALASILVAKRRRAAFVRIGVAAVVAGLVVLLGASSLQTHLVDGLVQGGAARPVADSILDLTSPSLLRAGWLTAVGGGVLVVVALSLRPRRPRAARERRHAYAG